MNVPTLIAELRQRRIELTLQGEDLRCRAPRGALTPELQRVIKENKPAILDYLRSASADSAGADSVDGVFRSHARRDPQAVALVAGDRRWSYGDIDVRAGRLAARLRDAGAGAEIRVALVADGALDAVVGLLGVLRSGSACVPIPVSVADRSDASPPSIVVASTSARGALVRSGSRILDIEDACRSGEGSGEWTAPADGLALILPASLGPLAPRRRIALPHRVVAGSFTALAHGLPLASSDVLAFAPEVSPWRALVALVAGASLQALDADGALPSTVTVAIDTPTVWRRRLDAGAALPADLRAVCAGEPLEPSLAQRLRASSLDVRSLLGFGETGWLAWGTVDSEHDDAPVTHVGRPASGVALLVLDDALQPAPAGVPGELHVGGSRLARGYLDDAAATAAAFLPDPFSRTPGTRMWRSGHRAVWSADGTLRVLGSTDEREWLRRFRLEPRWVESSVRSRPEVRDAAAVVATADDGRKLPQVHVQLEPDAGATMTELRQALDDRLPAALTAAAFVASPGPLPLTRSGRIDRVGLAAKASGTALPHARPLERKLPGEELDELIGSRTGMSKNQLLVWAGQRLKPESAVYNITALVTLHGAVDPEAFRLAFQAIVDGSDAFRTVIVDRDGLPLAKIREQVPCNLELRDLSDLADPDAAAREWGVARSLRTFDISRGLFEVALLKLADDRYGWYLGQHHLITDAWTVGVIFRVMSELYRQALEEALKGPPTLPQFAEYVAFEEAKRDGAGWARARDYWRTKLAIDPEPVEFYRGAGRQRRETVERIPIDIGAERSAGMRAVADRPEMAATSRNLSRFNAFTAVLLAYLFRVSGIRALSVGTPLLNRTTRRFKETIGLFMQVAPLRVVVEADDTFFSLAAKVNTEMLESMRRQRYPTGNSPQHPAYDVLMNYQTAEHLDFAGMNATVEAFKSFGADKFALLVRDYEGTGAFVLDLDFHHDSFDASERERTIGHLLRVMDACLADPTRALRDVGLLSDEEIRQVTLEWNGPVDLPATTGTIVDRFLAVAERSPGADAAVFEGETIEYGELRRRAVTLAARLVELGIRPETRVGVCLERSLDLPQAVLGVWMAGAAYVPLDPDHSDERLSFVATDAGLALVVTQASLADRLEACGPVLRLDDVAVGPQPHATFEPVRVRAEHTAYAIYTSGSTGRPKGVTVSHANLIQAFEGWRREYRLDELRTHLQMANFAFDVFAGDFVRALGTGARLVICPQERLWSPDRLYELMRRESVDLAEFVPVVLRGLVEHLETTGQGLEFMKLLVVGSDSWYVSEHERTLGLCGDDARFVNSYGVTEATIDSCFFEGDVTGRDLDGLVPIGRPFPRSRLYVLDGDLEPVPAGVPGELCIGGDGVTPGYLGRPGLTAERFAPDPFSGRAGARMYRTGDRARHLDDGNVEFLGRVDHQVKIRGFRVELGEIESVLVEHAEVREAVTTLHDGGGGSLPRLVAYVVPEPGRAPTVPSLREHLKRRLADYMVPAAFVALDALPLLPNGKIDRRALPAPEPAAVGSGATYVEPATDAEQRLARIWAEVLGVARVGAEDNFFELGGHSLAAMRVMSEIQRQFGRPLPMAALFQDPTVRHLARSLDDQAAPATMPALLPLRPGGAKRPFFCVHGSTGLALNYLELAAAFDKRRPFHALQSPAIAGGAPLTTVEAMAAHYVECLRRTADGPYLIGGHSFGGIVAFEMARQLRAAGEHVALCAVIDMATPDLARLPVREDPSTDEDRAEIVDCVAAIGRITGVDVAVTDDELRPLGPDQARGLASQLRGVRLALERRPNLDDLPEGLVSVDLLRGALAVSRANADALAAYRPGVHDGNLVLFRAAAPSAASGLSAEAFRAEDGGWSSLLSGRVDVQKVAGDHFSMLTRPNVRKLARRLQAACDAAERAGVQQTG